MNIVYLVDASGACAWYRCQVPGKALSLLGHDVKVLYKNVKREDLEWCDVLVLQRLWQDEVHQILDIIDEGGKLSVYEIDDDLWTIHPSNPSAEFWTKERIGNAVKIIKRCGLVTTTTEPLAAHLRKLHGNVVILPNSLPDDLWPCPKPKPEGESIVLGWGGSPTHYQDFKEIIEVIPQVLESNPQVEVYLAGADKSWLHEHERIKFLDWVSLENYPKMLTSFNIGLAPLANTRFNSAKSNLKAIEMGATGIPFVASKVYPYECVENGVTGFLASNGKDWLKYLQRLIDNESLRVDIGRRARNWAEHKMISKTIHLWEEAYGQGHAKNH